jgi:hypothetical protein
MLTSIHATLSATVWLFFLIIGLWGLVRGLRGHSVDGSYYGALAIGELLFVAQGIIGLILFLQGGQPVRSGIHVLYGVFAIVFLPFVYGTLRGDDSNRGQWVFAFATLFLFGVALRSISTGG